MNYSVQGSAQPGQDFQPLTGTVILRAGQTSVGVAVLTVNEDVVFHPTDMIVGTWPTRLGQVFVDEGQFVPAGTPLLSLTDTGFTVTLKATASDRTKLQIGQQVDVTLTGGAQTAQGVISQLDDTATVNAETSEQTYEGKVDLQGDLGAADGALVTLDVVIEEKTDVLTVPIAAVKQNGEGQDVVRVIDIDGGGKVTEVPVTTGLSEGSFIEISEGLKGDEVVIVEVDTPAP